MEELNIVKASRDSLQIGFDEAEKKLKDTADIVNAINKKVANLEGSLKAKDDTSASYKAKIGGLIRLRSSRYNYVGFHNAVAQLLVRHLGLDVTGIYPNKLVDG